MKTEESLIPKPFDQPGVEKDQLSREIFRETRGKIIKPQTLEVVGQHPGQDAPIKG